MTSTAYTVQQMGHSGYWLSITSLPTREEAERRMQELRGLALSTPWRIVEEQAAIEKATQP
jgi:hypothetical protein